MIDLVSGVATVPAVVALVNAAKRAGLPDRFALLLAVILGVALNVAVWAFADYAWFTAASSGLLLGLGAAGLYDLAPTTTDAAGVEEVEVLDPPEHAL